MNNAYRPGLDNVIATETDISFLDLDNEEIVVRGYDLLELAKRKTYLDVALLLLDGALPTEIQRTAMEEKLKSELGVPQDVFAILKLLPQPANMMDLLRTGISALASFDPELEERSRYANYRKAIRLLAKVPQIVANGYRANAGLPIVVPRTDLSYSGNFLSMITGREPTDKETRIFDQSLVVYSEHELPNSTFAARVIASTLSDLYGALTGAVASLKGTLHGGPNEAVMNMLLEAGSTDGLVMLMRAKLARKERINGFGHRVYMRMADPRAAMMREALSELADAANRKDLYDMCVTGERFMRDEKGLYPNLDYYAAPVHYLLGIPIELYTPIFLAARTAGICAHVMEQHGNNRLFRPRVLYSGPRNLRPAKE